VVALMIASLLANIAYSTPAPFLPLELKSKAIDAVWVGIIFTAYPVAIVITAPLIPKLFSKYGRKLPIVLGLFLMGAAFVGLGIIGEISNKNLYVSAAIAFRMLQGVSSVMINTTLFSIGALYYKDHSMAYISYITAMEGLGTALGAPLGAVFYTLLGYDAIFICCGALMIGSSIAFKYLLNQ
jgi:MFS family permease